MSISDEEIYNKLITFMEGKSQRQTARELGISAEYLNDIIHRKRRISGVSAILKKFGLKQAIIKARD